MDKTVTLDCIAAGRKDLPPDRSFGLVKVYADLIPLIIITDSVGLVCYARRAWGPRVSLVWPRRWPVLMAARSADQLKETAQLSMVPNGPI